MTGSAAATGGLNSAYARAIDGPSDAIALRAASKAAMAFFEYILSSIDAFGCARRYASKLACAFAALPALASQTPR